MRVLGIFSFFVATNLFAANLMDIYCEALMNDQVFQQAIAQRLSDKEAVPISRSALLPTAGVMLQPTISKTNLSGTASNFIGTNTQRGYALGLTVSQTVFDFAKFATLNSAKATSKSADATFNAAIQDLMLRSAKAYFTVLKDEENLNYAIAAKNAYNDQLQKVNEQYKVGLKTITDVFTAKASYSNSYADYIAALNALQDSKANLRVMTGNYYSKLSILKQNFPFITPEPANIDEWIKVAQLQNWSIKALQYQSESARQMIKKQFAGHLPSLVAEGNYTINFNRAVSADILGTSVVPEPSPGPSPTPVQSVFPIGTTRTRTANANLTLNIPLLQGGYVTASTRKAQYDYKIMLSKLEQQIRNTINETTQNYLDVIAGISRIKADKQTIKSAISSLEGMRAAYELGTETLVDVLNQQQKLYQAQKQLANDRYTYVYNVLALKAHAGTLCVEDLKTINGWLVDRTVD